jgi:hypothetical protein
LSWRAREKKKKKKKSRFNCRGAKQMRTPPPPPGADLDATLGELATQASYFRAGATRPLPAAPQQPRYSQSEFFPECVQVTTRSATYSLDFLQPQ